MTSAGRVSRRYFHADWCAWVSTEMYGA